MPTNSVAARPPVPIPANRRARAFALLLAAGGLIGVVTSVALALRVAPLTWLIAAGAATCIAVFAWSGLVGPRLWQADPRARKCAIALYALQIPVVGIHGFKYDYFTGVAISILHNPGGSPVALDFGAGIALMFGGDSASLLLGVNVVAILACAVIAASQRRES
jgi:hypothetical protein